MRIHVAISTPKPWQHSIGRRCSERIGRRSARPSRRKRAPRRKLVPEGSDRTVECVESAA